MSNSPIVWIAAITTLSMISFMFRGDNRVYQVVQNAFVGVAAGNAVVVGWQSFQSQAIKPLLDGQIIYIIPIVLGLMLFARFIPGLGWLARYPMSLLVASGAGLGLAGAVQAQFLTQIRATFVSLNTLDNIILFAGVLSVICYFFFTQRFTNRFKGTGSYITLFGRWIMMIGFGATFGNAVMGRCTLMIGRLQFLLTTWLGIN